MCHFFIVCFKLNALANKMLYFDCVFQTVHLTPKIETSQHTTPLINDFTPDNFFAEMKTVFVVHTECQTFSFDYSNVFTTTETETHAFKDVYGRQRL